MSVDMLKKMLKSEKLEKNIFLLFGEEVFLKLHYKNLLVEACKPNQMEDLNTFVFTGKGYKLSEVDEAIEALPVFADKKLLLFENSLIFKPDGRTGAPAEYRDYWSARLKDVPDYVNLIFVESEIDKRSALYKYIDKNGISADFAYLNENEMIRWTVGLFQTMGKQIGPHDAKYLVEICDDGMMAVKREAEKLSAYTQDRTEVMRKDIEAVVTPSVENRVFDMIDALIAKNIDLALCKLNDLFLLKEDANRILGAVIYHVDKLVNTKLMLEKGADKSAIMSKLKIAPFAAGKYMRDCAKYSLTDLACLLKRCGETDRLLKSNSMDNTILLEMLLMDSV